MRTCFQTKCKIRCECSPFCPCLWCQQILLVSQPVRPAEQRTIKDYWEHMPELGVCVHHHLQPRKKFQDKPKDNMSFRAGTQRLTVCEPCQNHDEPKGYVHDMESQNPTGLPFWWTNLFCGQVNSRTFKSLGSSQEDQRQIRGKESS